MTLSPNQLSWTEIKKAMFFFHVNTLIVVQALPKAIEESIPALNKVSANAASSEPKTSKFQSVHRVLKKVLNA